MKRLLLFALCPLLLATPELRLTSGPTTITVTDGGPGDSCPFSACVTYLGPVGSWDVSVTTGFAGGLPVFELNSVDRTPSEAAPITLLFTDVLPPVGPQLRLDVGGALDSTGDAFVAFGLWTGNSPFDQARLIGSVLSFSGSPFSGYTLGAVDGGSTLTIGGLVDLGHEARGLASFDAAATGVPEPASIWMLGVALLWVARRLRG